MIIGSVAALGMIAIPAMAQDVTGAVGAGTATATPDGATATGGAMGATMRGMHKKDRRGTMSHDPTPTTDPMSSSTTTGSGSVYTDRNHASGGVTASGSATGTGDTAAGTTIDAYGATDKTGSSGEVYGGSSASTTTPTKGQ